MAYGNRFLESGEIIREDQFSWTTPGFAWGNSYFAYQILTAWLFDNLGYLVTVIIFGVIVAFSILLILPKKLNFWSVLLVGLGSAVALANVGIRPHNLDWPFFACLLILVKKEFWPKFLSISFWFVFFAIWANIHVGFVFGLLILAAMIILDSKRTMAGRTIVILAAMLGTLLTPFHWQMWKSIFLDSAGFVGWTNIAALQSTVIFTPYNIFLAISGLIFVYIFRSKFKEVEPKWFIVASFLFLLAFFVVDFAYIWAIMFIFLATRYWQIGLDFEASFWALTSVLFSFMAAFLALVLNFVVIFLESGSLEAQQAKDHYPVGATKFLVENGPFENLFNEYAWGGYVDWQAPSVRVFIDGRMAGWKKSDGGYILADYLAILAGDCALAERWQIKTVLVEAERDNPCFVDFREVYRDSVAKILVGN